MVSATWAHSQNAYKVNRLNVVGREVDEGRAMAEQPSFIFATRNIIALQVAYRPDHAVTRHGLASQTDQPNFHIFIGGPIS